MAGYTIMNDVTARAMQIQDRAEYRSHVDFLQRYGCDAVQGFYFSKPVSAKDFEALLRAGSIAGGGG